MKERNTRGQGGVRGSDKYKYTSFFPALEDVVGFSEAIPYLIMSCLK